VARPNAATPARTSSARSPQICSAIDADYILQKRLDRRGSAALHGKRDPSAPREARRSTPDDHAREALQRDREAKGRFRGCEYNGGSGPPDGFADASRHLDS
jgi:hypothetical protein